MKKFLTILYLLPIIAIGQTHGGEAIYKVVITKSWLTNDAQGSFRDDMVAADLAAPDLRIRLDFNSMEAIFTLTNKDFTRGIVHAAGSYCDCNDPFFYSLSEGKSMQYNSAGPFMGKKQYLIEKSLDLKWKIEKDTKKIDQYTCYKATALTLDSDGKSKPVEAWFCPEIPFAYGPRGFGGLPGLILELRYDRSVIGLESLQLSSKPVSIKMPTEGKRISFAEFHNINKAKLAKFLEEQQK